MATEPDDNSNLNLTSQQCGPGCNCGEPAGNKKIKTVVFLLVVLAACSVLAYKIINDKHTPGSKNTPIILESMNSLNEKAADKDAVFICVPAPGGDGTIKKETVEAIDAVMRDLKSNKINAAMYTLKPGSADYAKLTAKPTPPEVMVISKGGSLVMVAGELTETNLMQAYVASTSSGGCGTGSSCGDSSKCK